jgi:hypothetical protein
MYNIEGDIILLTGYIHNGRFLLSPFQILPRVMKKNIVQEEARSSKERCETGFWCVEEEVENA